MKPKILIALVVAVIVGLPLGALAVRQASVNSSRAPITLLDDDDDADRDAREERDDNSGPGSGGEDNSGPGSGGEDNSGPGSGGEDNSGPGSG